MGTYDKRTVLSVGTYDKRTFLSVGFYDKRTVLSVGFYDKRTVLSVGTYDNTDLSECGYLCQTHLSECGFLPGLLELLLQVSPDAHLDVHDTGRGELAQQVLQLHVAWAPVKEHDTPSPYIYIYTYMATTTFPVHGIHIYIHGNSLTGRQSRNKPSPYMVHIHTWQLTHRHLSNERKPGLNVL